MTNEDAIKEVRESLDTETFLDLSHHSRDRDAVAQLLAAYDAREEIVKAARRWSRLYMSPTPEDSTAYRVAVTSVVDAVQNYDKAYPPPKGDADRFIRSDDPSEHRTP